MQSHMAFCGVGEIIVKIRKQKPNLNVCQVVSVPAATYQCYSKVLCTMSLSHFQPANTCSTVNTVWSRGTYRIWHKALFCEQSARCCVVDKKCKVKFRAGWKPHSAATFQVFVLIFILSSSAESFSRRYHRADNGWDICEEETVGAQVWASFVIIMFCCGALVPSRFSRTCGQEIRLIRDCRPTWGVNVGTLKKRKQTYTFCTTQN